MASKAMAANQIPQFDCAICMLEMYFYLDLNFGYMLAAAFLLAMFACGKKASQCVKLLTFLIPFINWRFVGWWPPSNGFGKNQCLNCGTNTAKE